MNPSDRDAQTRHHAATRRDPGGHMRCPLRSDGGFAFASGPRRCMRIGWARSAAEGTHTKNGDLLLHTFHDPALFHHVEGREEVCYLGLPIHI